MPIATPEVYADMISRAKEGGFAYPAINCTSSETINAALRGFADAGSDGIIQFSTGGAEFGSGAEGSGVSSHKVIYNMDCIGTLPSRNLRLADNTIDQYVPKSEVFLGYRYVPR